MSLTKVPQSPEDYRCSIPVQLRFRDFDGMGHVNNAVYLSYFELGREAYLRSIALADVGRGDFGERFPFILGEVQCRYLSPIAIGDEISVHLRASRIGTKSWDFEYLMRRTKAPSVVAVGASTQIFFDYKEGVSVPVPDWLIEAIEKHEGRPLRTQAHS